jgi:hypothetical protein
MNNLTIPSRDPPGTFVFKVLKVYSPKAPNGKWKAKVAQRKGGMSCRYSFKHIIKVNVLAPNGDNGALGKVCAKPGNVPKAMKNYCKVLNILLNWSHKNGHIICI